MTAQPIDSNLQLAQQDAQPAQEQVVKIFEYNAQALALLGIRTSVAVATVLAIPDAVALIPGSTTVTAWILALVGCWTAALVLWFVFFVGFLHMMRILTGGIRLDGEGIRLWRFGKLIAWSKIKAVSIEDEHLFSKIFSYDHCVKRLTIFVPLDVGKGLIAGFGKVAAGKNASGSASEVPSLVVPHYVPSFFFTQTQFADLCTAISERTFALPVEAVPVLLAPVQVLPALRQTHKFVLCQRIVVSLLVACGIGMFMARKAVVLYSYNEGLKLYREGSFQRAEQCFSTATHFEPTFAPAWHGLAGSEFNLARFDSASEHWKEALKWKPDYVEAKVSLAYLSLQQRDFQQCEKLLRSALALDPANSVAMLNRADLNMRTGHIREAIQDARLVISQEPDRNSRETFMATCLLAQAKVLQGKSAEALQLLAPLPVSAERLRGGENLSYRLLVGAQAFLATGQISKADKLTRLALQRGQNIDALLVMAQVKTASKDYETAQSILDRCRATMPNNPWIYIRSAELDAAMHNSDSALANLKKAEDCRPADALSLSSIARLYLSFGAKQKAIEAARTSLKLEPVNPWALQIIERTMPPRALN